MTDNTTPRDAIENVIDSTAHAMSRSTGYTSEEVWLDNPDDCADAVIAYLWEQADRPEVVEEIRESLYTGGPIAADLAAKDRQTRYTETTIEKVLTALIGPLPDTEQEREG